MQTILVQMRKKILTNANARNIMQEKGANAQSGGDKVKVNKNKLYLAMARACMNSDEVYKTAELPRPTFNNAIVGRDVRPATVGKIAKALGVDVTEILED